VRYAGAGFWGLMKISALDRIFLLGASLLAAYMVAVGIDGLNSFTILCYTVGFGVILVASLLMIILGFDVLESPLVVILSTLIPLSISMGLISEFFPLWLPAYVIFSVTGFLAVILTRTLMRSRASIIVLAIVHGVAGLLIFGLPIYLSVTGITPLSFLLVGLGGALIGLGGLLLFFMRTGSPFLSRELILKLFPALLLLTTAAFVAGFVLAKI
jgi:hypothetical protein